MDPFADIRGALGRIRRALNHRNALEAVVAAAAMGLLGALGGLLFAAALHPLVGVLFAAGALPLISGFAWRLWWRPRRSRRRDTDLAAWVEGRLGDCRSALVTAVEVAPLLEASAGASQDALGFSPALAHAAAERAAERLAALRPEAFLDARRLRRLLVDLALVVAVGAALIAVRPDVAGRGVAALAGLGEAPAGPTIRTVEQVLGHLSLELRPPSYLHLAPHRLDDSHGDVEALAGTEVRFEGVLEEPARDVVLVLESDPASRWPLERVGERTVRGALRVGSDDRYQFLLTAPDGALVRERRWRSVRAHPDAVPTVQLRVPERDREVHPGDSVAILADAQDDHGLARVELVVTPPRGEPKREPLRSFERGGAGGGQPRAARAAETLDLAGFDLRPGDTLTLWVEARDGNTATGPGVGRSAPRKLFVYNPDQEHEALLAQLEALVERLVDALGARLESAVDQRRAALLAEVTEELRGIGGQEVEPLTGLDGVVVALRTDPLVSDDDRLAVREARDACRGAHDRMDELLGRSSNSGRHLLADGAVVAALLDGANQDAATALEGAVFVLKGLVERSREDRVLADGRQMLDTQRELMDLMERLKRGDASAQAEAQRKLGELAARLRNMRGQMRKLAERVPYENQNRTASAAGPSAEMRALDSQIAKIQELLAQGDVDEAMRRLEALSAATQKMVAGMEADFQAGRGLSAAGKQVLGDLQRGLGEVMDGQHAVRDSTAALEHQRTSTREAARREAGETLGDEAAALGEALRGVPDGALHPRDRASLDKLRGVAREAREALRRGNLEAAGAQVADVGQGAKALATEVGESEARESDEGRQAGLRGAMKALGEAARKAQALGKRLGRARARAEQPGADERRESGRLRQRQRHVERELAGLQKKLGEAQAEQPSVGKQLGRPLREAAEAMGQAREALGDGAAQRAREAQERALEQLGKAREALEQAQRPDGPRREVVGVNDPRERVGVPTEGPGAAAAYREELNREMGTAAPERFREAVRRYYEELVK